jgi:hypothetical protein
MVESDYKNNRVQDPTRVPSKQVKAIKKYVVDFFNKAVKKRREHDKKKKERADAEETEKKAAEKAGSTTPPILPARATEVDKVEDEEDVQLSDDEMDGASDDDNDNGKRKRASETPATPLDGEEQSILKKPKLEAPPPPPPPPPPAEDVDMGESDTPTHDVPLKVESDDWEKQEGVKQEASPADTTGGALKDDPEDAARANGHPSPVQLATPSTNGTYEHDLKIKGNQKAVVAGGQ